MMLEAEGSRTLLSNAIGCALNRAEPAGLSTGVAGIRGQVNLHTF